MKAARQTIRLLKKQGNASDSVRRIASFQAEIASQNEQLHEARAELRESSARYNDLYQRSPVAFLSIDKKGLIRDLNAKMAELLGFSQDWLVNRPFVVFVAKGHVRTFLAAVIRSSRHKEPQVLDIDLSVGWRLVPVEVSIVGTPAESGITQRMSIVDMTDIRKTESQLRESVSNWHSLVHNAPDVIITLDRTGQIAFANGPFWGRTPAALVGTPLFDYVPPKDRPALRAALKKAFRKDERVRREITHRSPDGDLTFYSLSFGPVHDPTQESRETTTLSIRDITDQKTGEEKLRASSEQLRDLAARVEAAREDERAKVAREIHDELGQALTVLKLDLSWLAAKTRAGETRKTLKGIMNQVDETIGRVRRIASELRPSMLDNLGLVASIEWLVAEFQKRTRISCKLHSSPRAKELELELELESEASAACFRVVQEALTNVMRHADASMVHVDLRVDGGFLRIDVSDNGRGFSEKEIKSLTTLGIVGMKERISRVNGQLNIQSRPGEGTRVEIGIPIKHD